MAIRFRALPFKAVDNVAPGSYFRPVLRSSPVLLARRVFFALALSWLLGAGHSLCAQSSLVRFTTDLGDIDVELLPASAPKTVTNFLNYVQRGAFDGSFLHRSVPSFVVQGGGYRFVNNQPTPIATDPPVANEFHLPNTRGTLAMAKLGGDPNSATSQWFFNQKDNPSLDSQNGGFTVFGRITTAAGLGVLDAINALPILNSGSPFDQLPVQHYSSGAIQLQNLVNIASIKPLPIFFKGEVPQSNGDYFLGLPRGPFGYYRFLTDLHYISHADLGSEFVTDANDGANGLYLYDFASRHTFYTRPDYFPYLYDFSLASWLYYYPDATSAQHYTSNPRYFFNFATQQVITL